MLTRFSLPYQAFRAYSEVFSLIASAERIIEIENLPQEAEYDTRVTDIKGFYEKIESIEFRDITFSYKNETVLENTSLSIKKGEFVAIAGISGIGKSTLLKLLLGVLLPGSGSIYFNLGASTRETDKGVRGLFAYVPQGICCFRVQFLRMSPS